VNAERRAFAAALYEAGRTHDAAQADRLARWRNVEPETAELLGVLVRAIGARSVLEIGTSNGYSTIWLGDAGAAIAGFDDASFDLVFLDAERPAYVAYWPDLVRVLTRPGLLAVDNVLSHAGEVADFRAVVEADERVTSSLVPIGAGLLLVTPTA
jgi:predicted O-methyltransferase YrrM